MNGITIQHLDLANENEIKMAALIHESTPTAWKPGHIVKQERVEKWCQFLKKTEEKTFLGLVAKELNGNIVGIHWMELIKKYDENCAHIISLWVSPSHRGHGIGKELKSLGEIWAKKAGAKFIATEVFYANQSMIDFNLKIGFMAREVEMIKEL